MPGHGVGSQHRQLVQQRPVPPSSRELPLHQRTLPLMESGTLPAQLNGPRTVIKILPHSNQDQNQVAGRPSISQVSLNAPDRCRTDGLDSSEQQRRTFDRHVIAMFHCLCYTFNLTRLELVKVQQYACTCWRKPGDLLGTEC